jgi:myosin-5
LYCINVCTAKYSLGSAEKFFYLNQSGCIEIEGVDDAKNYEHLRRAFTILTISDTEQEAILRLLAALLHIGNLVVNKGLSSV